MYRLTTSLPMAILGCTMSYTIVSVKVDPQTKKEAMAVAESLGIPLSNIIKALLKHFIRTKRLSVGLDETPNAYMRAALKQAEKDYKVGKASPKFYSADEAIQYLEKQGI